ncbi:hypothetical protein L227DRAFT_610939 [Lentinus tigrinus ALCF2SS1-6]|uniref:Uncharacterized protein n=1 Tax=Lentinus tigrinus ALCF2SS1-6 TaxID=1328759 RepID=A0A5C2SAR6_9APHY|nr:hypothetical protein L227DRAFT_610939 [Lentinus tigrinus ALCF2SS1-6]
MAAACSHLLLVDEDPFGRVDRDFDRYCGCNDECIHDEENDKTANEFSHNLSSASSPTLAMDAFFVIATPVPAEDPAQEFDETFADHERLNTTGSHSGCVIA